MSQTIWRNFSSMMSTEFSCFLTLREKISAFWQSVSGKDVRKSHFRVHMIVSTQKHCVKTYAFFFFSDIERKFFDLSAKNCSGLIFKTGIYESKGKIWKKFFEKLFFSPTSVDNGQKNVRRFGMNFVKWSVKDEFYASRGIYSRTKGKEGIFP